MAFDPRALTAGIPPATLLATFAIGAAGAVAGHRLGLPLGALLGSLVAVGLCAAAGLRVAGHPVAVPQAWRFVLIPVIGVAIGATFTPELLAQAAGWGLSLLALLAYVPLAHAFGFAIYRRIGRLDLQTAYYSAIPGGLIESMQMGEEAGADVQMLTMLQFLRLIMAIVLIPVGFGLFLGHAVGSASGVKIAGAELPLGVVDVFWLVLAAAGGWWAGKRIGLPAPIISGPILASGAVHLLGLTRGVPPDWLILVTQWVVGTSLGARFAGLSGGRLRQAIGLAALYTAMAMGLALAAALLLGGRVGEPAAAVFLAFAPGGIAEMTLVALSLKVSVVYVTLHHILRILLAVGLARAFAPKR
jgi:membrane AbrB-like protein